MTVSGWIVIRKRMAGGLVAVAGAALLLSACGGGSSKKTTATAVPATSPLAGAVVDSSTLDQGGTGTPPAVNRTPAHAPTEKPDNSGLARLVIPRISVNARFITMGLIAGTNTMDSPKNKDDVAYYDFSPQPTNGGNTLVSGHVDWFTGQTGVFWDLKKLEKGDEVQLVLQDGRVLRYRVTWTELYDADSAPIDKIVGDTVVEAVTLITCEGTFSQASAEYNKRRVVRAERVYS